MIEVTRMDGRPMVVNADLIRYVEETPDTLISLTSGDRFMVKERMDEVVRRAISYARAIRTLIR